MMSLMKVLIKRQLVKESAGPRNQRIALSTRFVPFPLLSVLAGKDFVHPLVHEDFCHPLSPKRGLSIRPFMKRSHTLNTSNTGNPVSHLTPSEKTDKAVYSSSTARMSGFSLRVSRISETRPAFTSSFPGLSGENIYSLKPGSSSQAKMTNLGS